MVMSFLPCVTLVITCVVVSGFVHVSTAMPMATKDSWSKSEFPNPQIDVNVCDLKGEKSWVCDPSRLLTRQEVTKLNNQIIQLRGNDSCQGWITGVAIVERIRLNDNRYPSNDSEKLEATRQFADYLRQTAWRFRTCDNDLVIVVSRFDRKVWTSTATGVRKKLSDRSIRDLSENTMELMNSDGCFYGLTYFLSEYTRMLTGKRIRTRRGTGEKVAAGGGGSVALGFLVCCVLICCSSTKVEPE